MLCATTLQPKASKPSAPALASSNSVMNHQGQHSACLSPRGQREESARVRQPAASSPASQHTSRSIVSLPPILSLRSPAIAASRRLAAHWISALLHCHVSQQVRPRRATPGCEAPPTRKDRGLRPQQLARSNAKANRCLEATPVSMASQPQRMAAVAKSAEDRKEPRAEDKRALALAELLQATSRNHQTSSHSPIHRALLHSCVPGQAWRFLVSSHRNAQNFARPPVQGLLCSFASQGSPLCRRPS